MKGTTLYETFNSDDLCESTLKLRVRFGRSRRLVAFTSFLVATSLITNLYQLHNHGSVALDEISAPSLDANSFSQIKDEKLQRSPTFNVDRNIQDILSELDDSDILLENDEEETEDYSTVTESDEDELIDDNDDAINTNDSNKHTSVNDADNNGDSKFGEDDKLEGERHEEESVGGNGADQNFTQERELFANKTLPKELSADDILTTETIFLKESLDLRRRTALQRKRARRRKYQIYEPKKKSLAPEADFAACLLIKDDNEILDEWIAYHYHTLNMRLVIVAVDPLSQESPHGKLKVWRRLTDLKILEWSDKDFMPENFLQTQRPPDKYMQKAKDFEGIDEKGLIEISNHRYRQRVFVNECLKAAKKRRKTWTMHIDTDEFVVPSKLFRQVAPDYVNMSSIDEAGSVLNLLQQTVKATPSLVRYPCISMLRLLFGSVENENDLDVTAGQVPQGFNATTFETQRWRYHAPPAEMHYHGHPKVIIDVSAIPNWAFQKELAHSIHRPLPDFCLGVSSPDYTQYYRQPIATNHYLGSWERYNGRSDQRRNRDIYDLKANVKDGSDEGIKPWLKGFVNHVGSHNAQQLLQSHFNGLADVGSELSSIE